jgi:hypothetical protein
MKGLFNKTTIIVAISGLLIGRYVLTPKPKVITKEVVKIVEVEKKQTRKKKVTTETVNSDGSSTSRTTETEDTTSETVTDTMASKNTKSKSGITLGMLAIKDTSNFSSPFQYGATLSVPLAGSLSVTGLATTSKQIGVGLAIEF